MTDTRTRTALVIGGGIAGPVTAMALQRAGIHATVYEAHGDGAERGGAFLTLATNGIDALRTIGADGKALEAGFSTPQIMLRSTTGKSLGATATGLTLPDGTTTRTLKRSELYAAVYDEATNRGIRIEHHKRLIDAEETPEAVRAIFHDGSSTTADLLIGADGVHSTVRTLIDSAAPAPTYSGLLNIGGYARDVPVDESPGAYIMTFGKRAFFGYAIAPNKEVWWFANVPCADEPSRGALKAISAAEWQRRLGELYRDDAGPATRLVQ